MNFPSIYILSGGVGASAEQLIYTVLAQYPDNNVHIQTFGNIRQPSQITYALEKVQETGGLVIHTFVDAKLRELMITETRKAGIQTIDLMGPLISWITVALGQEPIQQPGRYRQLHRDYFDRVSAIDYTLAHDDGKNKEGWPQAEIILVGASRSGKTPLSVYLAVLGWKVANIPLVPEIPVPPELFDLDPSRVVGLMLDAEQLLLFRRQRQARLGVSETSAYTDLEMIQTELQQAQRVYRQGKFHILNITDKTIEQGADEIIKKMAGRISGYPL